MSGKKSVNPVSDASPVVATHAGIKAAWSVSTMSIKQLMDMGGAGKVNTDLALQRPEMPHWQKPEVVDSLIDTILSGYPMPPIFAASDGSILSLYDGKQRYTTLRRIYRDLTPAVAKWAVKGGEVESTLPDGVRGKVFSEWDDSSQDAFLGYPLIIVNTEFDDDDSMQTLFIRLNKNGLPLTPAQAYRGSYLDKLTALDGAITDSVWATLGMGRPKVESLLMQVCNGAFSGSPDYASKTLPVWFAKWEMLSSVVVAVNRAVKALSAVVTFSDTQPDDSKSFKRFLKPLHLESYLWAVASGVIGAGVVAADDHLRIVQFFGTDKGKGSTLRDDYIAACQSSTGSASSVTTRHVAFESVLSGGFVPPVATPASDKGKSKGKGKDEPTPASDATTPAFVPLMDPIYHDFEVAALADWGRDSYDWALINDALNMHGCATRDPKPYTDDKGVRCVAVAARKAGGSPSVFILDNMLKAVNE